MSFLTKISLYISVFIPLYILIILKTLIDLIFQNISFNILNSTMLVLSFCFISIGLFGVISLNKSFLKKQKIKIVTSTNITDQHFLNYFSLFVLFAISFDLTKVSFSVIYLMVLIFIGIVYIKNKLFYINPFLNLIGYSFYDITFTRNDSEEITNGKVFSKTKINPFTNYIAKQNSNNLWFIEDQEQ